jgi:DNA polymerase (family 10)
VFDGWGTMGWMLSNTSNAELAAALEEYAALLELSGANAYATRAYRRAATLIHTTPVDVAALVREGRVRDLRGIGAGIEQRLQELVRDGQIADLEVLRRDISLELAAFGRMHGFAADRFVKIGAALGIRTVAELRAAAARGRLREVHGIGPHTEAAILGALSAPAPRLAGSLLLNQARGLCSRIADALGGVVAGDPRRWKDTSERLAVVVATDAPADVQDRFASLGEIVALTEPSVGVTVDGTPIELVTAPPAELGTALVRATGSAEYVATLEPLPAAPDEDSLYRLIGRPWLPPELRELPEAVPPPGLVDLEAIRGDLHCHTTWSDGRASVRQLADAAIARGYDYVAVCDHTANLGVVPGLNADAVRRQGAEIAAVNAELAPFRVLRGIECDILPDGRLDLPDDALAELDWVQISLHAGQRAPRAELTARVVHAMHHPAARCLSHPTGRIIGHRPENRLDIERTIQAAIDTGIALEVNGLPSRLDLSGEHVREAIAAGVDIVCSSDSHSVAGLDSITFAVHTARRGGAARTAVLNTRGLNERGGPLIPRA